MDMQGLLLKLTLHELEKRRIDVSISNFDGRKNVQKLVYLLQKEGYPFSYFFRWYIKGPYSPALTSDLFNVSQDAKKYYDGLSKNYHLDADLKKQIEGLCDSLKNCGLIDNNTTNEGLELAASARYLVDEEGYNIEDAIKELERRKPHLSHDQKKLRAYLQKMRG